MIKKWDYLIATQNKNYTINELFNLVIVLCHSLIEIGLQAINKLYKKFHTACNNFLFQETSIKEMKIYYRNYSTTFWGAEGVTAPTADSAVFLNSIT